VKHPTLALILLLVMAHWAPLSRAQEASGYPSRHIRMICPFTSGSTLDVMARVVAERLATGLGHNIVVDNRPGANGVIGTDLVAKAPADGHTMLMTTGSFTGNQVLVKKLPYDTRRDFSPITQIARSYGLVLVVHPGVQANSVKELVALAKSRPGRMTYGSSGVGNVTHLVGELFNTLAGVKITHVPYKGAGPAMTDLLGRQIDMNFVSTVFVQAFIKDGRVRPLALTGGVRSPVLPDLPTFKELGYKEFDVTGWYGLWFPAGTPAARVNRIHGIVRDALGNPAFKTKLDEFGLVGVASPPAEFAQFLKEDLAFQARIVKMAGIEPQ
jgi:tripartite-type tricarboxylate transporter receptor subunit TctC